MAVWLNLLRNVGKSTLYNTLSDSAELIWRGFNIATSDVICLRERHSLNA